MYNRLISLPKNKSFFLFGQRGTGKTTLLKELYHDKHLLLDLLDTRLFYRLSRKPWELADIVGAKRDEQKIVIIDEIQKIPILLNEVHRLIEEKDICFALTGSSARRLRKDGVNLLAGRALKYHLYPLSYGELDDRHALDELLSWGSLPAVLVEWERSLREEFLYSYVNTYLQEEIILESLVKNLDPFNRFLEVAAQNNGDIINYSNIARDCGVSSVTVKSYFQILVDTLLGSFLDGYHVSLRKRQKKYPKFYFHDLGIVRALTHSLSEEAQSRTFEYGMLFESFIINEIFKINEYGRYRAKFSYLRVEENREIDLVIEKQNKSVLLIEIKSKEHIDARDVKHLDSFIDDFKSARAICISKDPERKKIGRTLCLPWKDALTELFLE